MVLKILVRRTAMLVVALMLAVAAVGCAGPAGKTSDKSADKQAVEEQSDKPEDKPADEPDMSEADLPQVVHESGEMDHRFPEGAPEDMRSMKNPMADGNRSDMDKGEALFQANCVSCHGTKGDGKGPGAKGLTPPPADFTGGHFPKMSDQVVYYIMTTGIKGSAMPGWTSIPSDDRWRIIHYLRSLASTDSGANDDGGDGGGGHGGGMPGM